MNTSQENNLTTIGVVRSPLRHLKDCPLQENEQAPAATIEIKPDFVAGIRNLKAGDEVLLLTWLHQADRSVIECYPRKEVLALRIGVFSTRSPDRPNPIGIHKVKITAIAGNVVAVDALEALDGTPILDIKPAL